MKMTMLSSFLILGATAFAAGNTYKVEISKDSVIEGKTIKAGEYKLSLENGNAVLKHGKETFQVPARQESTQSKADTNELIYKDGNLSQIQIGGTTTRIIFEGAAPAQSGM